MRGHFDLGKEVNVTCFRWEGLRKLVGQDISVVVVRHDGFYVKVHRFWVQSADSYIDIIPEARIPSSNNSHTFQKQSNNWQ